ncbi:MAG: hypothetical protein PHN42_02950 [Bacilli bacterium]|nr:hypothetical protein [Bacilli bacterium]
MEKMSKKIMKEFIILEEKIFDLYAKLKKYDIKKDKEKYDETINNLKICLALEQIKLNKINNDFDMLKMLQKETKTIFKFVTDHISVNNALLTRKEILEHDNQQITTLKLFDYDDYTKLKLIYNRLYNTFSLLKYNEIDNVMRMKDEYYNQEINCVSVRGLEKITGIYSFSDENLYFRTVDEYVMCCLEEKRAITYDNNYRKRVKKEAQADLILKNIILMQKNKKSECLEYMITDETYNYSFVNPLVETKLLNNNFDYKSVANNLYQKNYIDKREIFLNVLSQRNATMELNMILDEININNDCDLGIDLGTIVSNCYYHRFNYNYFLLQLLHLRACNLTISDQISDEIIFDFMKQNEEVEIDKSFIYNLVISSMSYKYEDENEFKEKNKHDKFIKNRK